MGLINPNQGTGNYTGIGPQTNFQAQLPMQPMQPMQQMQQSPLQYNVNRAMNLIGDVVGYKFQIGELNENAARQCAAYLRSAFSNGAYTNRLHQQFTNIIANDTQLSQFIDFLITEWVQQAALSGLNTRGVPQPQQQPMYNQQPMYGQYQQPVYNQYQQGYNPYAQQQPVVNPYAAQPRYNQGYNPYAQQQPVVNPYAAQPQQMPSGSSVDSIYGQAAAAKSSAMYNSAPIPTASANRVISQAPQVSTYTAPQAQPQQAPQPAQPQPKANVANTQSALNPVVGQPRCKDYIQEEIDGAYPDDDWEFQIEYFKRLRLLTMEYDKKITGTGATKKAEPATADVHIVEVSGEPSASDTSVIKKVVAMNKKHNANKPFVYRIGYKKQIVTDVAYSLGHRNHDAVMSVWDKFYELEDDSTLAVALNTKPFEIAKALINKFKETSPAYQTAIEPIIVKMYNDVMNTASMFKDKSGQYSRMQPATCVDDIYSACDLNDTTYGEIKGYEQYTSILMNALYSSLFAMYIPYNAPGYLDFNKPKERAAALANPEIGVIVNYATDRYVEGATGKDGKPVPEDKLKNLIDNELHKHFVIQVSSCVMYTNLELPFKNYSGGVDFTSKKLDVTNGNSSVFTLLTAPTESGEYSPARVCIPHVVVQQDKTTDTLPFIITSTVSGSQLARRIIA